MYIIIIGCGRVGSELARSLADARHNVVVVDREENSFKRLGADFNGLTVLGNGFDVDLLKEAGIEQSDVFCALTDSDNANIMSAQVARKIFHTPKVIARINDVQNMHVYKELEIEAVNSSSLLAATIKNKIVESRFSSLLLDSDELSTIEVPANDRIIGKKVAELNLPAEAIIVAVVKGKKEIFIPRANDRVEQGDLLVAVVRIEGLAKVKNLLGLK